MTALDRALIKAYRADRRAANFASAPAAAREPTRDLTSTISTTSIILNGGTVALHAPEPVLSGPHHRVARRTRTAPQPTAEVPSTDRFSHQTMGVAMFRFDVGLEGIPTQPYLQPQSAPVKQEAPVAVALIAEIPKAEPKWQAPEPAHSFSSPRIVLPPSSPSPVHLTSRPLSSFSQQELAAEAVQPELVVDRFAWPSICDELDARAGTLLDRFTSTLISATARGHKAVALVGTDFGAGCTTTTLCVARRMAQNGLKPLVLDADFSKPALAERLSVVISQGWEAAIDGSLPLAELLIESLEDKVILAPLGHGVDAGKLDLTSVRASVIWRMMRDPFDVLLIDVGTVENETTLAMLKLLGEAVPLDGVYAVCDERTTPSEDLANFSHQMASAGVRLLGAIENFTDEDPASNEPGAGLRVVHS